MATSLSELGLSVEVYGADWSHLETVGLVTDLMATCRHLSPATATFGIDPGLPARDALNEDGASVVIMLGDSPFMSGWVVSDGGDIDPGAPLTYEVIGHDVIFWDSLGWPKPGSPLSGQDIAYWTRRGTAETVFKEAVQANLVARLGRPVTVAPDLGRGGQVDVSLRFHPLMDRFGPQLAQAGIGVSAELIPYEGLLADVYETVEHDEDDEWDAESGVITAGSWRRRRPQLSQVIAGAQGEGAARALFGPENASWRASMLPRLVEGFVDARDISEEEGAAPVAEQVLTRMREKLTEATPEHDLALTLDSTPEFAYGDYWHVGDTVRLAVRPDVVIPAQIHSAELTITEGLRIRPVVGAGDDPELQKWTPMLDDLSRLGRTLDDMTRR